MRNLTSNIIFCIPYGNSTFCRYPSGLSSFIDLSRRKSTFFTCCSTCFSISNWWRTQSDTTIYISFCSSSQSNSIFCSCLWWSSYCRSKLAFSFCSTSQSNSIFCSCLWWTSYCRGKFAFSFGILTTNSSRIISPWTTSIPNSSWHCTRLSPFTRMLSIPISIYVRHRTKCGRITSGCMCLLTYSCRWVSSGMDIITNCHTILAISCCIITNCDAVTASSFCSTANGNAI